MPIKYDYLRHQDSTTTPLPSNPLTPANLHQADLFQVKSAPYTDKSMGDLENGVRDTARALDLKGSTSQKALKNK